MKVGPFDLPRLKSGFLTPFSQNPFNPQPAKSQSDIKSGTDLTHNMCHGIVISLNVTCAGSAGII
jgi:hypothetical protein